MPVIDFLMKANPRRAADSGTAIARAHSASASDISVALVDRPDGSGEIARDTHRSTDGGRSRLAERSRRSVRAARCDNVSVLTAAAGASPAIISKSTHPKL